MSIQLEAEERYGRVQRDRVYEALSEEDAAMALAARRMPR